MRVWRIASSIELSSRRGGATRRGAATRLVELRRKMRVVRVAGGDGKVPRPLFRIVDAGRQDVHAPLEAVRVARGRS